MVRIGDGTLAGQLATSEGDAARAAGLGRNGAPCPVSYSDPSPFTAVGSSSRTYCDVKKELVRVFLAQVGRKVRNRLFEVPYPEGP